MPRRIRHIDIYLPLDYSDGGAIDENFYVALGDEIVDRFGGYTVNQRKFPLKGIWKTGERRYEDRVVVFGVMDFSNRTDFATLRYLKTLKSRLMKELEQLEILITLHDLTAI
jgi:hypothetical protein